MCGKLLGESDGNLIYFEVSVVSQDYLVDALIVKTIFQNIWSSSIQV